MTEQETLLINIANELDKRLEKNDHYNLIKASGLIRQLLLDEIPLIDVVNKNYKLKIRFKTQKQNHSFQNSFEQNGVVWETVIGVHFIGPKHNDPEYTSYLKRAEFLKYNIIYFEGKNFTVKDIIKLCANILGGVHFGKPKKEKEIFLDWANKTITYADGLNVCISAITDIIKIIVEAIAPLINEINKTTATANKKH